MRLSAGQCPSLKAYFVAQQGDDCRVLLFGSRTDDGQRGGAAGDGPPARAREGLVRGTLGSPCRTAEGGRRVDVLLLDPTTAVQTAHAAALTHGEAS